MKILIVYAHHELRSFNAALFGITQDVLKKAGHEVKISDLYAMNFKPTVSLDDFSKHLQPDYMNYMLDQQYAAQQNAFTSDLVQEQEKVKWADLIIFHFPIWWFSVPAILKGWIDRVFATGVTWDFGKIYKDGLLAGKKALLVVTTGGSEELYQKTGAHGTTIEEVLYFFQHGILHFCGMQVLPPFIAFSVFQAGDAGRKKYLQQYAELLTKLETIKSIKFR